MDGKCWLLRLVISLIVLTIIYGKSLPKKDEKSERKVKNVNAEKKDEESKKGTIRISGPWGSDSGLDRNVDPMEDSYVKKIIASNEGINFNKDLAEAGEVFDVNGIEDFYDKNALITYEVNGHEVPVHMKPKYTPQTQPLFPEYGHDSPDAVSAAADARREQAKKPHATTFYGLSMKDMPEYGVKDTQSVGAKNKPPTDTSSRTGLTHHLEPDQYLKDLKVFQGDIFHKHGEPSLTHSEQAENSSIKSESPTDTLSAEYEQAAAIAKASSGLPTGAHDMESDDRHRSESETMREAASAEHGPHTGEAETPSNADSMAFHNRQQVFPENKNRIMEDKIKELKAFYQHEDSPSHITPIENPPPSTMIHDHDQRTADNSLGSVATLQQKIEAMHKFIGGGNSHSAESDSDEEVSQHAEKERNEAMMQASDNAKFFEQLQKIHQYREKERQEENAREDPTSDRFAETATLRQPIPEREDKQEPEREEKQEKEREEKLEQLREEKQEQLREEKQEQLREEKQEQLREEKEQAEREQQQQQKEKEKEEKQQEPEGEEKVSLFRKPLHKSHEENKEPAEVQANASEEQSENGGHEHKKQKAKLLSILGELTNKLKGMEASVKGNHPEERDETAVHEEQPEKEVYEQPQRTVVQKYRDSDLRPRPQLHSLEDVTHPSGTFNHHEVVDSLFRADENGNFESDGSPRDEYKETGLQQPIEAKSQPAEISKEDRGSDDDFPDYNEVKDAATFEQNLLRRRYHSSALRWSDDLSDRAMKEAQELAKKKDFDVNDLKRKPGENVAIVKHSSLNVGKDAADQWAKEGTKFDFVSPIMTKKNSDFVQMLWKNTREYGMGVSKSDHGDWIVVAMYDTPAVDDYTEIKHNIEPDQPVVDPYGDIAR